MSYSLIVVKKGTTFTWSLHNDVFAIDSTKTMWELPLVLK